MKSLAQLSSRRAVSIAVSWVMFVALVAIALLIAGRLYTLWRVWHSDGGETFFMRVHVRSWMPILAITIVPPIVFLTAWRAARRRLDGDAP